MPAPSNPLLEPASRNFLAKIAASPVLDLTPHIINNYRDSITQRHLACFKHVHLLDEKLNTSVVNILSEGSKKKITLHIASPKTCSAKSPVGLFIHGGGWCAGSLQSFGLFAKRLAIASESIIVSVDYGLAPENPFSDGLNDCQIALKWIIKNVSNCPFVIGDSAGGNLAAALCLMEKQLTQFISAQILLCPLLDPCNTSYPSRQQFGQGDFLLNEAELKQFCDLYLSNANQRNNPLFAPVLASDLAHLPATLILTAECDMMRDEGEHYSQLLIQAGVSTKYKMFSKTIHDFMVFGDKIPLSHSALKAVSEFIKKHVKR